MTRHQNFDDLKVGDVVWVKNSENGYSHAFVITGFRPNVAPGDWYSTCGAGGNVGVYWENAGGQISNLKKPVTAAESFIYTRYGNGSGTDIGW